MGKPFREVIVDGYNLLHKLYGNVSRQRLRRMREEMETLLLGFQQSSGRKVTVVYDGSRIHGHSTETGAMNRVFTSSGCTADEWIIEYLKSLGRNAQMFTIVSSDRLIRMHAAALGASCELSEEFLEKELRKRNRSKGSAGRPGIPEKFGDGSLSDKEVARWMHAFESTDE